MREHNLEPCIRIEDYSYASGYQLMTSVLKDDRIKGEKSVAKNLIMAHEFIQRES